MGAQHGSSTAVPKLRSNIRTAIVWAIVLAALAALITVVACWPNAERLQKVQGSIAIAAEGSQIISGQLTVAQPSCTGSEPTGANCGSSKVRLSEGAQAGKTISLNLTPDVAKIGLKAGDRVLLLDQSADANAPGYYFYRVDRSSPMIWLGVAFVIVVLLVARRRGLMALLSLGFAAVAVMGFLLPAVLSGQAVIPAVLAASTLILIVMLYATHGFSMRTSVALLGSLIGLVLSTGASWLAVMSSHLGELKDDYSGLLGSTTPWVNVQQVVIGSVILASLGALNDVTITQASALWELRAASKKATWRELFTSAMRIGRDHIASNVYTLAFVYLGTALILLLATQLYGGGPRDFFTTHDVAEEIVRALIGGLALTLAMPITTLLGALVLAGRTHSALKVTSGSKQRPTKRR